MKFSAEIMTGKGKNRVGSGVVGYIEANSPHDAAQKLSLLHKLEKSVDLFVLSDAPDMEVWFHEIIEVTPQVLREAATKLTLFRQFQGRISVQG
jgi:hypothetical protein